MFKAKVELWKKMVEEGRLIEVDDYWNNVTYVRLRLNPDEMERLRYQPRQVHTNLEALGES
jgi:hypothetical protein